jgi:cell division protein YceG involved in septum cleavage
MPLAIDATIRYYLGDWTHSLRVSQLDQNEPYNSRLHRGLPPTPIGNPGLASIKAAAHPAHVSYLYYVRKPGKSGEHAFSSTDAKFEQDVAKYNASRGK